jgi:thiamine kinase-like enzyme
MAELPSILSALKGIHSLASQFSDAELSIEEVFHKIAPNAKRDLPSEIFTDLTHVLALLNSTASKGRLLMHGDCKAANIILTDAGPQFIDWEWAEIVNYPGYDVLKLHWAERENPRRIDFGGNDHVVEQYLNDKDAEQSCRYVHSDVPWRVCVLMYWATRLARSIALYRHGGMPVDFVGRVILPALASMKRVANRQ